MSPEQQIQKLHDAMVILNRGNATTEDVLQLFELSLHAISAVKTQLEDTMRLHQGMSSRDIAAALEDLSALRDNVGGFTELLSNSEKTSQKNLDKVVQEMYVELRKVEDLIPELPDLEPLKKQIQDVVKLIPKIPDEITGAKIVSKINDLPTDNEALKIDAKHIKNLPKQVAQVVQQTVGSGSPVKGVSAGRNISVTDDPLIAGYKKVRLDITVATTPPTNPEIDELWIDSS